MLSNKLCAGKLKSDGRVCSLEDYLENLLWEVHDERQPSNNGSY